MALASATDGRFNRDRADDVLGPVRAAGSGEHVATGRMQRELIERAQRGDADAFRKLVCEASGRLYAITFRILRDPDRAQDALQRALIQLWEGLPGLRDPDRFDAWSYRLVVHALPGGLVQLHDPHDQVPLTAAAGPRTRGGRPARRGGKRQRSSAHPVGHGCRSRD